MLDILTEARQQGWRWARLQPPPESSFDDPDIPLYVLFVRGERAVVLALLPGERQPSPAQEDWISTLSKILPVIVCNSETPRDFIQEVFR